MVKVWCSEMLDYVVDETVQIHGGAGYVEDYPAERGWRDARVNRIFEGTNEINRMLIPGRLTRRAMKGELPLFQKAMALVDELTAPSIPGAEDDGFLAAEAALVRGAKKVALMCLGVAAQKLGEALGEQQEVLAHFADVAMEVYALESALLRARKLQAARGDDAAALAAAAVRCYAQSAIDQVEASARYLLSAVEEGDTLRTYLAALRRLTRREPVNTVALRRQVAQAALDRGGFPF
jgi:alkylation response protein AidB-like acyl-CoA dehydrogenase